MTVVGAVPINLEQILMNKWHAHIIQNFQS